jgi:hypothetical protein
VSDLFGLLFDEPTDELSKLLADLRWLTLRHPIAARSAVRSLIAEGRRFATTEEGAAWKARLSRSELVRRGQTVWDVGTLGSLDHDSEHCIPTQVIDAFARASARRDLETAVARRLELDEDTTT